MAGLRKGFTLIELLVVIAIIAILIALLVPAVQKVRAAAQGTQCSNNLKQIALGMHSFHDSFKRFPQGGGNYTPTVGGTAENGAQRPLYFSWPFHILPYIEQGNIFKLVNVQETQQVPNPVLTQLDTRLVPIYYCPARRNIQLYHGDSITDYAGNTGTNVTNGGNGVILQNSNTVTFGYFKLRMIHITDGQSNTLMVGERRINLASINGGDSYDNEPCFRPAGDCDTLRRAQAVGTTWLTPAQDVNDPAGAAMTNGYFGGNGFCQFGSSHHAGMFTALADGSVRRIGYAVDPTTFKNLCVRNDGQTLDMNKVD